MNKNTFLLTLLFLLLSSYSAAQLKCTFRHYSSEDGLSQNTVMNMLQDHNGVIWLATWDGINKFDGYNFKTYKASQSNQISLTNNRVDLMHEDCYGYIWVLTYDSRVHRFDPRTETFEAVPESGEGSMLNISDIKIMPKGSVWLLTENDGAIRVMTDKETHKLSTQIYSLKSGLFPCQKVFDVRQDKSGNEWLLTDNGLALVKPDAVDPVSYFIETKETDSRKKQLFYSFQELGDEIFFGSDMGRLWKYHKKSGRFELLQLPVKGNIIGVNALSNNEIVATTAAKGLFVYNTREKDFTAYTPSEHKELAGVKVMSTYADRSNELWMELDHSGEVCHFNPRTRQLKREVLFIEPGSATRSDPAFHIHEDVNNRLWVHPFGGGFSYFDRKNNCLVPFYNRPGSSDWMFSNKIHSAMSDAQGNLWLCTHSKGLEKVTFVKNEFELFVPKPHDYESLSNEVRALLEDREGNIWVSVKEGFVHIYDAQRNYLGYLTEQGTISKTGKSIQGVVYCFSQAKDGTIWLATKGDGLVKAVKKNNVYELTRFKYSDDDIYSLSHNDVYSIFEDVNGRMWVATFGGGLNYIEKDKSGRLIFINHRNNLKEYPIDRCYRVRHITSGKNGYIWVGTTAGALRFNSNFKTPESISFQRFSRVPSEEQSLSNNDVHWITCTQKGEIYLATFGGGLNKLLSIDEKGKASFKSFTVKDGALSDVMLSMQEDDRGNLWIGTEGGLCKFIPGIDKFENYDEGRFYMNARFNEGASARSQSNRLFFGTSSGTLSFIPAAVRKSTFVPHIILSKLLIDNVETVPGKGEVVLRKGINETDELVLPHNLNIFTIQYAALDMVRPEAIKYAFFLQGFDKGWNYVDKQRTATYTNLPKGDYILRIRSTNSDGVWVDNERQLAITILPSFWETPLAYFFYLLLFLVITAIVGYVLFIIYRLKHEVSVEQQVSDIKLRFFTNISHELRTPLTLIAGPVEHVLQHVNISEETREQLEVVKRNTDRMLRLVNQLLDFRKIQNKKMKMHVSEIDIVPFVRRVMANFDSVAEEHQIDFVFESEVESQHLWVDEDKLEKIIFNLLSNAFKYTPAGRMITVFVHDDEKQVSVGVQDQGIGIAENKKGVLFVRFENLMDKNLFNQSSSGIGLSLVKELVDMHKATITVDSKLGEGSCFTVHLLKGKEHYDDTVEFILNDDVHVHSTENEVETLDGKPVETQEDAEVESGQKETMLLVEDNAELRFFLRSIFSSQFRVVEAADGVEGAEKALKFVPDIIISDVMMPHKDGIELTKELKSNLATSHIPIVLLTAKTNIESKLEGLGLGADDYITKPFSSTYLLARVDNLLSQRRKLQELYRAQLMDSLSNDKKEEDQPKRPEMSVSDRKFMDKLVQLMNDNMDNGDMVVDDLVRELAVSRSVFFKKLKSLTGLAPIEFIKSMRVKRAAELIEEGEYNMTQISYMVGINDPRYFSKCFKQQFGMTPTEYKEKLAQGRV